MPSSATPYAPQAPSSATKKFTPPSLLGPEPTKPAPSPVQPLAPAQPPSPAAPSDAKPASATPSGTTTPPSTTKLPSIPAADAPIAEAAASVRSTATAKPASVASGGGVTTPWATEPQKAVDANPETTHARQVPVVAEKSGSSKGKLIAAAAVVGLLGVGGVVALTAGGGDSDPESNEVAADGTATEDGESSLSPTTAAPTTDSVPGAETTPDPAPETELTPETQPEPEPEPTSESELEPEPTPEPEPEPEPVIADQDEPVRSALFSEGTVILQGRVASAEIAAEIAEKTAAVVGPENVVVAYEIDPTAPTVDSAPLFVQDLVLFETGGSEIAPDFEALLGLGVVLLAQNEGVEITIVGHTDSEGPAEANQKLSENRVQAIIDYIDAAGGDISRLIADPRGETEPIADNSTAEGRRQNRRVEFIITGFVD